MVGNRKPAKPRRRVVDGHPGVYYKDTAEGEVYEVMWTEDGRTRWKTIGPNLEEAIAERAALSTQGKAPDTEATAEAEEAPDEQRDEQPEEVAA